VLTTYVVMVSEYKVNGLLFHVDWYGVALDEGEFTVNLKKNHYS
jgi:hypothetical protein